MGHRSFQLVCLNSTCSQIRATAVAIWMCWGWQRFICSALRSNKAKVEIVRARLEEGSGRRRAYLHLSRGHGGIEGAVGEHVPAGSVHQLPADPHGRQTLVVNRHAGHG